MDTKTKMSGASLLSAIFALTNWDVPTITKNAAPLPDWKRKSRNNQPVKMPAPKLANSHAGVFMGRLNWKRVVYKILGNAAPLRKFRGIKFFDNSRERYRVFEYKHRPGYNRAILSQHDRVFSERCKRDPQYAAKVQAYIRECDGVGVPLEKFIHAVYENESED
jgi:hypothetical protein